MKTFRKKPYKFRWWIVKKKTWQQSHRIVVGPVVALVVFFLKALNDITRNSFSHCGEAVFVFLWTAVETAQTGTYCAAVQGKQSTQAI